MVRVLIILRHPILSIGKYPLPFLVPVILSVHIPLGACSKPVSLDAPVTHHGVSYKRFLLHHTNCDSNTGIHFCMLHDIDPYIRKFVSPVGHSHHGYFIDPRHIGDTIHLWTAFVIFEINILRPLSADFTELQTLWISPYNACRRSG